MKRWNYDELADSEPDGNSEWYSAEDMDSKVKEIKRLGRVAKQAFGNAWELARIANQNTNESTMKKTKK